MPDDFSFNPATFSGVARLFPLPNLVTFPHVMQPLHIFEPRYRAMLEEALAEDELISMAILAPGWESDYDGRPPIRPIGCLCRVATHHRTDDGKYNVLLVGVRRIRIVRELPPFKLFREAEVELLDDLYPAENSLQREALQRRLVSCFQCVLPKLAMPQGQIEHLLSSQVSLGMLTDIVAYTLQLDQKIKEDLLAQPLPDLRALLLLECLEAPAKAAAAHQRGTRGFPPEFSVN